MTDKKKVWTGFQFKLTLALVLSMLCVLIVSNAIVYRFYFDSQFTQLQNRLKIIARTAALTVDPSTLMAVPLNREGLNSPEYKTIAAKFNRIKNENPSITYVYTMTKTSREGIYQFIVDADPMVERRRGITAYPGDKYDATRFPALLQAFNGATADPKLEKDEWGSTLSGYAPIYDAEGRAVAVLGVDMLANDVYALQGAVQRRVLLVLLFGVILSVGLGTFLSRRMTDGVAKLVEGTRRIGSGDLEYKVKVKGEDEIKELAQSFNSMADNLAESQRKVQEYFYGVIQAMVRIVEAKDAYTRGHSERVAEYAAQIALRMGYSPREVEVLKEIAVLHDIGKMAIQDEILNKKDKLTDAEWEIIRTHPVIGEDILKPVSLSPEMLSVVRGHHERWDGKGYPDGLKGKEIHKFAQILSVADAYDAMTSSRAYRPGMPSEKAIDELRRNKGSQFSPDAVDILGDIIEGRIA